MKLVKFWIDRIRNYFMTPKTGVPNDILIVDDTQLSPVQELIKLLKDKIGEKASRIVDLELELGRLRSENAGLRSKIDTMPPPETPKVMHFYTTSALKSELERRSRLEKENYASKSSDH